MAPPTRKPAPSARAAKGKSTHDKRRIVKSQINKKLKIKSKYNKINKTDTPEYLKEAFKQSEVEKRIVKPAADETRPDTDTKTATKSANKPANKKTVGKLAEKPISTRPEKSKKPNPFAKLLAEHQKKQEEKKKEAEEARLAKEANMKQREQYYAKRKTTSAKLTAKTARGQPVMRNHIDHLLNKIKSKPETYQK